MTTDGPQVVFLPGDPARTGSFAFWHTTRHALDAHDEIVVALPGPRGPRRRRVAARTVPVDRAIPLLLDPPADCTPSMRSWHDAVLTGLSLIARGRLFPAASTTGLGTWRTGPADPADTDWLHRFAAAMPPEAYAVPRAGTGPIRLTSPENLVTSCWDALADVLARDSAEAPDGPAAFTAPEPRPVGPLAGWLDTVDRELRTRVRLVLRVSPPEPDDAPFALVLQMRSGADPSLLVDVADLWRAPAEVLSRFGADAETEVLLGLRRAARLWPALRPALAGRTPTRIELSDTDLDDLLDRPGEALGAAGIDVFWPAELTGGSPRVRAATKRPANAAGAAFGLPDLLDFQWRASVDGVDLPDDELSALAEAKRPLVRLRGRWIRVDRNLVARLRRR
ncbi:MAG: SNF2 helicase-associated domain-containing protein, partial [Actinocatenispora sp.]